MTELRPEWWKAEEMGKTTGIYLFKDGPNPSCVQVAEKKGYVCLGKVVP